MFYQKQFGGIQDCFCKNIIYHAPFSLTYQYLPWTSPCSDLIFVFTSFFVPIPQLFLTLITSFMHDFYLKQTQPIREQCALPVMIHGCLNQKRSCVVQIESSLLWASHSNAALWQQPFISALSVLGIHGHLTFVNFF